MSGHDAPGAGRITQALAADHQRIGALLAQAERGDRPSYDALRGALLRHIGVEEKILLPALRAHGCLPAGAAQLRLDHAALVAMLVPSPTPELLAKMRALLALHDPLEEGADGIYPLADATLTGVDDLLERIARAPVPPLAPHVDAPRAFAAIDGLLARASAARALPGTPR
jgi:hypothetical protein